MEKLRHIQFRLTQHEMTTLENLASTNHCTKSAQARKLLFDITHDIQFELLKNESQLYSRAHSYAPRKLDIKIRPDIIDYLKLNGYCITSCLIYQMERVCNK